MTTLTAQDEYTTLVDSAAVLARTSAGLLRLTGDDRVDFLQRMSTNDIAALQAGQSTVTVLTDPTARILFAFTVICRADDLLVLPAPSEMRDEAEALGEHLRSQIFFMDKVKVEDWSADWSRLRLMGPNADEVLSALDLLPPPGDGAWASQDEMQPGGPLAVRQTQYDVPGYELIVPLAEQSSLIERLVDAGAPHLHDEAIYHARRVELGQPAVDHEIVGDYTPLEVGLAWTCAEDKGCYTGQEIIARQITYDKVTRVLVGLRHDLSHGSTASDSEPPAEGAPITLPGQDGGRPVGYITSTAYSPALTAPIALAIVRRAQSEVGTTLMLEGVSVEVVELPFG